MKNFRFGLDSVLDYRQQVLDGLQGEYAKALERVRQQEARKEAVELQYARSIRNSGSGRRRVSP